MLKLIIIIIISGFNLIPQRLYVRISYDFNLILIKKKDKVRLDFYLIIKLLIFFIFLNYFLNEVIAGVLQSLI